MSHVCRIHRAPLTDCLRHQAAAAAAACALVATAGVVGSREESRGGPGALLQMEQLRVQGWAAAWAAGEMKAAALPSYTPAALALAKSQKEVRGIVEHAAERKKHAASGDHSKDEMAGGTSLTKKQLAKIVLSARAAAEKNNALIYAADDALADSQKELGNDAAKVSTLSTASGDMGHTFNTLINVAASNKSKSTQAALQAARAAASKDREEMANAANIIKESQEILGNDAVKLPTLGDPVGGPSSLFKSILAGISRTKQAARGGRREASSGLKGKDAEYMALKEDKHNFMVNREFLAATSRAHFEP